MKNGDKKKQRLLIRKPHCEERHGSVHHSLLPASLGLHHILELGLENSDKTTILKNIQVVNKDSKTLEHMYIPNEESAVKAML